MMRKLRKLFSTFWRRLGGRRWHKRLPLVRARLTVEPLEERWLLAGNNLLWIGPAGGNWSLKDNWTDPKGAHIAPAAGNSDSLTFDSSQNWGGNQGTNTDSTDDIADPSLGALAVRVGAKTTQAA